MQLEELVTSLNTFTVTTDNSVRNGIEGKLEENWVSSPAQMMLTLQSVIGSPQVSPSVKSLAAVLLRRGMGKVVTSGGNKQTLFQNISPGEQQSIVQGLLNILQQSSISVDLSNRVSDVISEAARLTSGTIEQWPQIMSFVASSLTNGNNQSILVALRILEGAPGIIPADQHGPASTLFVQLLSKPSISISVISGTVKSFVSILMAISDNEKRLYCDAIKVIGSASMCQLIVSKAEDDEEAVGDYLSALIDGVIESAKMFKEVSIDLYSLGLHLSSNVNCEFGVRSLAIELSLCLLEQLTGVFKKRSDLIQSGLSVIIQLICEVEDCEEWYSADGPDADEDIDEVGILGEQCLDRFAIALTGKFAAPQFFNLVSSMLKTEKWNHQYGALKAIASSAEGFMDVLEDQLEAVLNLIWPSFQSSHGRVQYAACHALGQLCTDFEGAIQQEYTGKSLESLVGLLSRTQIVRVQQHAAAALVNFAEGVDSSQVAPFLDGILSRLVHLLTNTIRPSLQQQLIATIASFSSAAEGLFIKYLDSLMPVVMACISSANPDRLLQCRAVEAISLFAVAVGKQIFFQNPHSTPYMEYLKQQQQSNLQPDDQMDEYLQSAWVRMCQVLGADFAPFLPLCLPHMIKQAQAEADVAVLDIDAPNDQYDESEWDFAEINGRRYGIHTACLEEKCGALENISAIADTMASSFAPFAQDCLFNLAIPLLKFDLHDGVEAAAADLTASCVRCMAQNDPGTAKQWASQCIGQLLETAKTNYSPDYTTAAIDAISTILNSVELNVELVGDCLTCLEKICRFASKKVLENQHDDSDDADGNLETVDDGEVVYSAARLFATISKQYKQSVFKQSQSLLKFAFEQIERKRCVSSLTHSGICIVVDALQWMPEAMAANCMAAVVKAVSVCLKNDDRDIRQAAIYGIGVTGESSLIQWEPFCTSNVSLLMQILQSNKSSSNAAIYDNAVSALIKLIHGIPSIKAQLGGILPLLIMGYPIKTDSAEFLNCYSFLNECLKDGQLNSCIISSKNVFEALLEACIGTVSKHIPEQLKADLKTHIPSSMSALGPNVCQPITSRFNMTLL